MKTLIFIAVLALASNAKADWTADDIVEAKSIGHEIIRALYFLIGTIAAAVAARSLNPHKP